MGIVSSNKSVPLLVFLCLCSIGVQPPALRFGCPLFRVVTKIHLSLAEVLLLTLFSIAYAAPDNSSSLTLVQAGQESHTHAPQELLANPFLVPSAAVHSTTPRCAVQCPLLALRGSPSSARLCTALHGPQPHTNRCSPAPRSRPAAPKPCRKSTLSSRHQDNVQRLFHSTKIMLSSHSYPCSASLAYLQRVFRIRG